MTERTCSFCGKSTGFLCDCISKTASTAAPASPAPERTTTSTPNGNTERLATAEQGAWHTPGPWRIECDPAHYDTPDMLATLQRIARWFGEFPATGAKWQDGSPVSYGAQYGSNGERDFMRNIAAKAIAKALWGSSDDRTPARPSAVSPALGYAMRLATALWEKHWKGDAPEWKPLPDVLGLLTQIDNMTFGLTRAVSPEPAEGELRKALADWMREPDHVENASLEWLLDWVNRRPLAALSLPSPAEKDGAR